MRQWIADLLIPFAEIVRLAISLVPMTAVRVLVFIILLVMAVWVFSLGPQIPSGPDRKHGAASDLRFFAIGVLALQALLYIIF